MYMYCKDAVLYQCILKKERKVSTSVIRTISLIRYHILVALDKGVRIIEVALYMSTIHYSALTCNRAGCGMHALRIPQA